MNNKLENTPSSHYIANKDDFLIPVMSFHSLKKAMRIIQEMLLYYFPLHELGIEDFFRLMPLLIFAEATAYQTDEEYEIQLTSPLLTSTRLDILKRILSQASVYDEQLETELQRGIQYWQMERALLSNVTFTEADIIESTRLKCCDYRYLHRLLFRLLNKPYDEELLELSWLVEQIGEIEDDLLQYEDDLKRNVYNTYDLFVRLYAENAPQRLQAYLDKLNKELQQQEARLAITRPQLVTRWLEVQQAYAEANPSPAIPEPIINRPLASNSCVNANILPPIELKPSFSYKALTKALVIVEEIITYYFPLHGLTESDTFTYLTELIFAEAILYQLDEEFEEQTHNPNFVSKHTEALRTVLGARGLYDTALEQELQCGFNLWKLEQQMCSGGAFSEADIAKAMHYRCGDYRFLHRLLFLLTGQPYNEQLIALCSLIEERGEIEDDLRQYHSDIQRNVYNSYRMLVRLYGKAAPARLQQYLDKLEAKIEQQAEQLAKTDPKWISLGEAMQEAYYQEHPAPAIPEPVIET
ncbi:MAG: hypothetical protein EPN17_03265 [Methylobacter sp.]|nr:MAG: hypothetical protein EPN17_03265 [Methylobacter sp.]